MKKLEIIKPAYKNSLKILGLFSKKIKILLLKFHNNTMSDQMKACPQCHSPYGYYLNESLYACPECGHEWNPAEQETATELMVKDANGTVLRDGDSVIVIKDLKVKGASAPVKAGTKVKNIRLTEGEHNIDCKIDGFGAMGLKSEFVRKA